MNTQDIVVVAGSRFTGTLKHTPKMKIPVFRDMFVSVETTFWHDAEGTLHGYLECFRGYVSCYDLHFSGEKAELAKSISTVTVKLSEYGELDMAFDTGDMMLYIRVRTDILGRQKAHLEEIPRGLWVCFPEGHQSLEMTSALRAD